MGAGAGFVCEGSTGMGAGVGLGVGEGMVAGAGAGVGIGEGGGCDRTKAGKKRNVESGTDMLRLVQLQDIRYKDARK